MEIMPGVFCDVDGTLLFNTTINEEVLGKLKDFSKTKKITLWTGGDKEDAKKRLVAKGIKYPLVGKYTFKGCTVEIVIDDMSRESFEEMYKIYSREYIQVKN